MNKQKRIANKGEIQCYEKRNSKKGEIQCYEKRNSKKINEKN